MQTYAHVESTDKKGTLPDAFLTIQMHWALYCIGKTGIPGKKLPLESCLVLGTTSGFLPTPTITALNALIV